MSGGAERDETNYNPKQSLLIAEYEVGTCPGRANLQYAAAEARAGTELAMLTGDADDIANARILIRDLHAVAIAVAAGNIDRELELLDDLIAAREG